MESLTVFAGVVALLRLAAPRGAALERAGLIRPGCGRTGGRILLLPPRGRLLSGGTLATAADLGAGGGLLGGGLLGGAACRLACSAQSTALLILAGLYGGVFRSVCSAQSAALLLLSFLVLPLLLQEEVLHRRLLLGGERSKAVEAKMRLVYDVFGCYLPLGGSFVEFRLGEARQVEAAGTDAQLALLDGLLALEALGAAGLRVLHRRHA